MKMHSKSLLNLYVNCGLLVDNSSLDTDSILLSTGRLKINHNNSDCYTFMCSFAYVLSCL